jgi:hypothetical protein
LAQDYYNRTKNTFEDIKEEDEESILEDNDN